MENERAEINYEERKGATKEVGWRWREIRGVEREKAEMAERERLDVEKAEVERG